MLVQVKDIQLEALTAPRQWSEKHVSTWGEIPHVGGKPSMQHTGQALVELELSFRLSQEFCDIADVLTELYLYKADGEVCPIITGTGVFVGRFVIISIDNKVEQTTPDGALIAISFDVQFKEYVPPPGSKDAQEGEAIGGMRNVEHHARPVISPAMGINNDLMGANMKVGGIMGILAAIKAGFMTLKQGIRMAKNMSNAAKVMYNGALLKVNKAKKIKERASHLPTSLDGAIAYADNLASIGTLANMSQFEFAANNLSRQNGYVKRDAAPVASFQGTKEGGN